MRRLRRGISPIRTLAIQIRRRVSLLLLSLLSLLLLRRQLLQTRRQLLVRRGRLVVRARAWSSLWRLGRDARRLLRGVCVRVRGWLLLLLGSLRVVVVVGPSSWGYDALRHGGRVEVACCKFLGREALGTGVVAAGDAAAWDLGVGVVGLCGFGLLLLLLGLWGALLRLLLVGGRRDHEEGWVAAGWRVLGGWFLGRAWGSAVAVAAWVLLCGGRRAGGIASVGGGGRGVVAVWAAVGGLLGLGHGGFEEGFVVSACFDEFFV